MLMVMLMLAHTKVKRFWIHFSSSSSLASTLSCSVTWNIEFPPYSLFSMRCRFLIGWPRLIIKEGSADWLGLSSLTFNSPHWHSENCISSRIAEALSSNRATLPWPNVNNGRALIKHPESSQVRASDLMTSLGLPTNNDTLKHKGA